MRSLLHLTSTLAFALTMTACAAWREPSLPQTLTIPPSLRQPCNAPSPPADGSRATTRRWMEEAAAALRECADRHSRLVESLPQSSSNP